MQEAGHLLHAPLRGLLFLTLRLHSLQAFEREENEIKQLVSLSSSNGLESKR